MTQASRLQIAIFTELATIALCLSACAAPEPVTVDFAFGRRGYNGVQAIWMAAHLPDYVIKRDDILVGRFERPDISRRVVRGLLRFENLNIPAGSKIVSAQLRLNAGEPLQKPSVAVYGLLRKFAAPAEMTWGSSPGYSTWNSLHHDQTPWAASGADKTANAFTYDGPADRYHEPDSTVEVHDSGWYTFDVTRSFANQFAAGKMYGWVFIESTGKADCYIVFPEDKINLKVTYIPASSNILTPPAPPQLRLLSFHLSYATTMAQDMQRAYELPFDGAAFFGVPDVRDGVSDEWLCNAVFGATPLRHEDYTEFIAAGKRIAAPPSPLTDNFLRVNVAPGTLETINGVGYGWVNRPRGDDKVTMWWSDRFDVVVENIRLAARVARDAHMKGILFDYEPYGGDVFSFEKLKDAQELGKSLEETKVQVRACAGRLFQAINDIYPDMTLITIFNLYTDNTDSLWNAFVDGMVIAADPRMRLVEGNEQGYHRTSYKEFNELYQWDYAEAPKFSAAPKKYLRQVEVGLGVWLNRKGWGDDPELNESSAAWQCRLENALTVADSYVWVYNNAVNWWSGARLPQAYVDATARAYDLVKRRRDLK